MTFSFQTTNYAYRINRDWLIVRGHAEDLGIMFDYTQFDSVLFIRYIWFERY